jgi:pimeloyl-ACP methyl ester carboxylesterase
MECALDKATIDYEEHGEGRPILFLHGWTMARQVEIDVYEKILATRSGWRRIYPDLPGMGRSIAKAGLTNQDDVLEVLLAFVDRVLPGRFVLAGTSGGGYLARAIAAQRRSRIDGLLLRVPAIIADASRRMLPSFHPLVQNDVLMATFDDEERAALGNVLVQKRDYIAAHSQRLRTLVQPAIDATAPIALEIRADPKRYGFSFDLSEMEKTFDKPTLIVVGRQDMVVGYRDAWTILESYPRATFAVIDRADHGWPLDTTGLFGALIDDWLARVAESEASASRAWEMLVSQGIFRSADPSRTEYALVLAFIESCFTDSLILRRRA